MSEGPRILLVEDNPTDLRLTLRALSRTGAGDRVHVARDGVEALDFIFCEGPHSERSMEEQPRVVLLDLKLPRVDGLEVLRRMKEDVRTRSIPIVMLTSSSEERDLVQSYMLGVNSYIVKPVNYEQLAERVAEIEHYWLTSNRLPGT